MKTLIQRRFLNTCAALATLALGATVANAEVNKAVAIDEWYLHETATCQNFNLSMLPSRVSCRDYKVMASVKVRNLTSTQTGGGLVVSLRTENDTVCGSVKIGKPLYANGFAWFDVECHVRGRNNFSQMPSEIEAIVHQDGNVNNGATGGFRDATPCTTTLPASTQGSCGTY